MGQFAEAWKAVRTGLALLVVTDPVDADDAAAMDQITSGVVSFPSRKDPTAQTTSENVSNAFADSDAATASDTSGNRSSGSYSVADTTRVAVLPASDASTASDESASSDSLT